MSIKLQLLNLQSSISATTMVGSRVFPVYLFILLAISVNPSSQRAVIPGQLNGGDLITTASPSSLIIKRHTHKPPSTISTTTPSNQIATTTALSQITSVASTENPSPTNDASNSDTTSSAKTNILSKPAVVAGIAIAVAAFGILIGWLGCICYTRRKQRNSSGATQDRGLSEWKRASAVFDAALLRLPRFFFEEEEDDGLTNNIANVSEVGSVDGENTIQAPLRVRWVHPG
ncbi:3820_t:CDS:1 [Paraglomus occultum]|uniref:3820_t:CDS:1 n=1 Tax=Paraglomus occultum TaxID=144539 RepID=A0A9N9B2V9_9GLOM|nr:3820_t:CDS:1 [Paraglomus occultum]